MSWDQQEDVSGGLSGWALLPQPFSPSCGSWEAPSLLTVPWGLPPSWRGGGGGKLASPPLGLRLARSVDAKAASWLQAVLAQPIQGTPASGWGLGLPRTNYNFTLKFCHDEVGLAFEKYYLGISKYLGLGNLSFQNGDGPAMSSHCRLPFGVVQAGGRRQQLSMLCSEEETGAQTELWESPAPGRLSVTRATEEWVPCFVAALPWPSGTWI